MLYYDTENLIVQDNNGKTPLHYAAENGTFSFIKQVTNFPDSYEYVQDNNGKTVSEHPEIGKHSESYTKQVKAFFASSELPNIGGNDDNDLSFTI